MKLKPLSFLWMSAFLVMGGCNTQPLPSKHNSITLNLMDEPSSFDPRQVRYAKDLTVVKQLYEGLFRHDESGIPQKALACEVEISENGSIYTFFLRESVWSNGEPLTAYDFERSWKEILNPSSDSAYAHLLYPIKNAAEAKFGKYPLDEVGVKAKDSYTLIVELQNPIPHFFELVALPIYFPVHPTEKQVSNGPFKIDNSKSSDSFRLEKNPLYWDAEAVKLDAIVFTCIKDNHTEFALFEKGDLHWLGQPISNAISTELITKMQRDSDLFSYDILGTHWFAFNTQAFPFNNLTLRKAFALALDRNEIISHILQGKQSPAYSPLPPNLSLIENSSEYNQDSAIHLFEMALKELNLTKKDFPPLILSYLSNERNKKIVQIVQQQWEKAFNLSIVLKGEECQSYFYALKQGKFHIASGGWIADFNDPLSFLELFQYDHGVNITGWKNQSFINELNAVRNSENTTTRQFHLKQAEQILIEEMPVAPLYHYSFDFAKNDSLINVIFSPLGTLDFKHAKLLP